MAKSQSQSCKQDISTDPPELSVPATNKAKSICNPLLKTWPTKTQKHINARGCGSDSSQPRQVRKEATVTYNLLPQTPSTFFLTMKENDTCPHCQKGTLELVKAYEPWYDNYLICTKCDSTYNIDETSSRCDVIVA